MTLIHFEFTHQFQGLPFSSFAFFTKVKIKRRSIKEEF